jgi:hypothetical protein
MDHMFFKEEERVPLPPLIYLRGHVTNGEGEKERGGFMRIRVLYSCHHGGGHIVGGVGSMRIRVHVVVSRTGPS